MFKNGMKLAISGGPFDNSIVKNFDLLEKSNENQKNQSVIIYGKNGSGKSTLCKAIREYKDEKLDTFSEVYLKTFDDNDLNDNIRSHIYIYDEIFIDRNVKFKEDGLDTIVLLGDKVDIDEELTKKKEELLLLENEISKIDINVYEDESDIINPDHTQRKILDILKSDGNWASRSQKIKGSSRKSPVSINVLEAILNTKNKKVTLRQFEEKLKEYEKIRDNKEKCIFTFENYPFYQNDDVFSKYFSKILEKNRR